jgi:hypothetical protein
MSGNLQDGATQAQADAYHDGPDDPTCPGCGNRHFDEHFDRCPLDQEEEMQSQIGWYHRVTDYELDRDGVRIGTATTREYADLFRASPDLLAACQAAESVLRHDVSESARRKVLMDLAAAIAKARP